VQWLVVASRIPDYRCSHRGITYSTLVGVDRPPLFVRACVLSAVEAAAVVLFIFFLSGPLPLSIVEFVHGADLGTLSAAAVGGGGGRSGRLVVVGCGHGTPVLSRGRCDRVNRLCGVASVNRTLVLGGDGTCIPVLPTPVACRSTKSFLSALLAFVVVEATSCSLDHCFGCR
jgi:hypothetical protein